MKRVLVFGGTGAIGREVLQQLGEKDISCDFTYYQNQKLAQELEQKWGHKSYYLDLTQNTNIRHLITMLAKQNVPDVFIHCAGIVLNKTIIETTEEDWQNAMQINCQSIFVACQELSLHMDKQGGDIILLGALDRTQSLPIPVYFAATQGAISAMTMALAKEFYLKGIRVNQIASGLLATGMSKSLDPKLHEDFQYYNSLKRAGTTEEIARVILWLALENKYMNGKTVPINGGI